MLHRRAVLAGSAALLAAHASSAEPGTESLPLWPGLPPGGGGPSGRQHRNNKGAVTNIAAPSLDMFAPSGRRSGAAVLIAGGGGYKRVEMGTEAEPAARWLVARGITAFVLTYRLPEEGWTDGPLAPLQDAQRALRLIRANAQRFGFEPSRIGVLGFSSGAHLLGLAATRSAFLSYKPVDEVDTQSARPALAALAYPVITLKPPYDRTSTRRVLVGESPSAAQRDEWSVETHVQGRCPPVFLVQAEDDPVSDPANSILMADACRHANVPVDLHLLSAGGHGFGMGLPGTSTAAWPSWLEAWLRQHDMVA